MLKKIIFAAVFFICIPGCKKDKSELIVGRWDFTTLEIPGMQDFSSEIKESGDDDATTLKKFVLGDKLILREDSTFDLVILKQYLHGKWQYDKESQNLFLKDGSALRFDMTVRIDSIGPDHLSFDIDKFSLNKLTNLHGTLTNEYDLLHNKSYCEFYLDADHDRYRNLEDDPYSIANNKWRVKPAKSESNEALKRRVLNHLDFWQQLFKDADENSRPYISYDWFASPLIVAVNGVQLNYYEDAKQEWDQNFYDSVDAHKGYQMMLNCFSKKLNFLQIDNKYKRNEDVLSQLKENFIAGAGK